MKQNRSTSRKRRENGRRSSQRIFSDLKVRELNTAATNTSITAACQTSESQPQPAPGESNESAKTERPPQETKQAPKPARRPAKRKTIESVIQSRIQSAQQKKQAATKLESSSYQNESRRPLVCLAFVLPLIMAYELGTILLGNHAFRSGVDQWLDYLLSAIGIGHLVLLPLVTAAILIVWHHRIDDHWKIRWPVISGMIAEAIGLGLILFWAANAVHLFSQTATTVMPSTTLSPRQWVSTTIAVVGSGIYEELFFRLILLAPMIHWARQLTDRKFGAAIGIVLVSLVFASLHYDVINPAGMEFEISSFFFRFVASIVFSILFLFRGFGIAVGAHVAFDVLTQL